LIISLWIVDQKSDKSRKPKQKPLKPNKKPGKPNENPGNPNKISIYFCLDFGVFVWFSSFFVPIALVVFYFFSCPLLNVSIFIFE
jgi:hypothetical protein